MESNLNKVDRVDDTKLVEAVRGSVEQIWQAGLGAFATAQHEGGEIYSRLVQEGMGVQKRIQQLAGERLSEWSETVASMKGTLGKQASGSFEKLESAFEDRVSRSLRNIGVPMHDDIQALAVQIGELQKSVDTLIAKTSAEKKPAAKKTAAKAAPKKAAAKPVKSTTSRGRTTSSSRKSAAASRV